MLYHWVSEIDKGIPAVGFATVAAGLNANEVSAVLCDVAGEGLGTSAAIAAGGSSDFFCENSCVCEEEKGEPVENWMPPYRPPGLDMEIGEEQ